MWLLRLPWVIKVLNSCDKTLAINCLTVVLPALPVSATSVPVNCSLLCSANWPRANKVLSTCTCGSNTDSSIFSTKAATACFSNACVKTDDRQNCRHVEQCTGHLFVGYEYLCSRN